MVYTATVENGEANLSIDTTGQKGGKYKLQTNYVQNNYYNNATRDSYMTLLKRNYIEHIINDTDYINLKTGNTVTTRTVGTKTVADCSNAHIGPNFTLHKDTNYDLTFDIYTGINGGQFLFGLERIQGNNDYPRGRYVDNGNNGSSGKCRWQYYESTTSNVTTEEYTEEYKIPQQVWTTILMRIRENNVYVSYMGRSTSMNEEMIGKLIDDTRICVHTWTNGLCGMSNLTIREYLPNGGGGN